MYIGLLEDNIFLKTLTQIQTCFNISLLCKVKIYRFLKIMNCSVINILNYVKLNCNCTCLILKYVYYWNILRNMPYLHVIVLLLNVHLSK